MSEVGKAKLLKILAQHSLWLADRSTGKRADFTNMNLHCAKLQSADLREAIFSGANVKQTNFTDANLTGAVFIEANASGALFVRADITRANFTRASLNYAIMRDTKGMEVNFTDCKMSDVDFSVSSVKLV